MKNLSLILCIVVISKLLYAQQGVSINTTGSVPDSSAILDVSSTEKGILIPRMSSSQRNAINSPADGLLLFNIDSNCFEFYINNQWVNICSFSAFTSDTVVVSGEQTYPRIIGYGGGLGHAARVIVKNGFQDSDILVMYENYRLYVHNTVNGLQYRDMRNDWNLVTLPTSYAVLGENLYVLLRYSTSPNQYRLYRYDVADIGVGGIQVTFAGQSLTSSTGEMMMNSDGTDLYFSYNAGNSSSDYDIARYTIAGSIATYQNTVSCGSLSGSTHRMLVDSDQNIYLLASNGVVRIFNPSGGQIGTTEEYLATAEGSRVFNWNNHFYFGNSSVDKIMNRVYIKY